MLRPLATSALWLTALGSLLGVTLAACSPGSDISSSTGATTGSGSQGGGGDGGSLTVSSSSSRAGGEGGQGGVSACPPDADGDDLPAAVEGKDANVDTDGDGAADYLDDDSDGDSIPDAYEGQTKSVGCNAPLDSDSDGKPDFRDTDSDDNGLPDALEVYPDGTAYDPARPAPNPADTDGDGIPDYVDPDNDGDSLPDTVELDAGAAVDSDLDGVPDLDDLDSDDDTIADTFEGLADPDADGLPAFRDPDSDGDGLDDACEAGPGLTLADPPPDTDSDGKYDSLDLDADGDGLYDAEEDANLDCVLDADETDPKDADSDDDGTSDFIEVVLESNARDPLETPGTLGKYYFVLPYLEAAIPPENIVPLKTNLNHGDVDFLVDTTATMGGDIQNLKSGMSTIVQSLHTSIPDLAVGVAGFDDFPSGLYGNVGDQPFYVAGPKGFVSTAVADNLAAILTLNVHDGGDFPESQIAAMHRALTDQFLIWDTGQLAPTGAPSGTFGSLHFRNGALPILVAVTDAAFHNGRRVSNAIQLHDPYSFNGQPPFPTPTVDTLVTAMNAKGARFIGVSCKDGSRGGTDPYEDMAYLTEQVASTVSPSAFGGILCGTGLAGTLLPPDGPATADDPGGTCRLVFDASTNGTGVSESVVNGVQALLKSIKLDLRPLAAPGADPIDAVDTFIESIAVNASGGNDEAEPGTPCIALNAVAQLDDLWSGPKGLVNVQDAVNETALGVTPSQKVCFKIVVKPNTTLPQGPTAQVFKATLTIKARNGAAPVELVLGTPRDVLFVVPPAPQ